MVAVCLFVVSIALLFLVFSMPIDEIWGKNQWKWRNKSINQDRSKKKKKRLNLSMNLIDKHRKTMENRI